MVRAQDHTPPELRIDAQRNQQRILRAAARLLADDPSASIQRIADEAQVARPTVYRRYPTKEALLDAILTEAISDFDAALDDATTGDGDAATAIGRLVRSLGQIGADYPILLTDPETSQHHHDDDLEHHAHDGMAAIATKFDALIARGQQEGTIRSDISSDVLRHSLLGALAMSLRLARRPATHLTAAGISEQVATLLVEGLRPRAQP